jgi:hypothetical protein
LSPIESPVRSAWSDILSLLVLRIRWTSPDHQKAVARLSTIGRHRIRIGSSCHETQDEVIVPQVSKRKDGVSRRLTNSKEWNGERFSK